MHHTSRGEAKIVPECTLLPLISTRRTDQIVIELAVFVPTDQGLELRECIQGVTVDQVIAVTAADLIASILGNYTKARASC